MNTLQERYSAEADTLTTGIQHLKRKNRYYIVLELSFFCLSVAAFAFYCLKDLSTPYIIIAAALLAGYSAVRRIDVLNDKKIRTMLKRRIVFSREVLYMQGDFSCFDDGERYSDPKHPFTYDLDVFGRDSLFNRIDRTVCTGGSDELARSLSSLPSSVGEVERKRDAIAELAEAEAWRTEFLARGQRLTRDGSAEAKKIDSASIQRIVQEMNAMPISRRFISRATLYAALLAIAGFYLTVVLCIATTLPASVPTLWGVLLLFTTLGLTTRPLRLMTQAVGKLHSQMQSYISLIRHIHAAEFKSAELKQLQETLFGDSSDALEAFSSLSDMLGRLDRRANILGLIIFNMAAMSDLFLVRSFLRWQGRYLETLPQWIAAISRIDALCSMAVMKFNHPETTTAKVIDADSVVFEAEGLRHPFLGTTAVSNDFTIKDGNYYIITGANMAGKSTFLRAIGINYLLAMNGMAVFSSRLKVSLFNLFSSMRTTDDLSHGISYFNAELLRLRQLIDSCKRASHTLIILDEILKGTNSLDKLNGSRLFLTEIARMPVSGVIATHDLELSKMEEDPSRRFHNYCFEIQLAENITYTYKISPGVARNQNATFLLRKILKDIP